MTKYYLEDQYCDSDELSQNEDDNLKIDNKNYVEIELNLIEKLKDLYFNVILPEIESNPSILQNLNKYSEDSFINYFRNNSSYYKLISEKQL